jgi:hypothetical protein
VLYRVDKSTEKNSAHVFAYLVIRTRDKGSSNMSGDETGYNVMQIGKNAKNDAG